MMDHRTTVYDREGFMSLAPSHYRKTIQNINISPWFVKRNHHIERVDIPTKYFWLRVFGAPTIYVNPVAQLTLIHILPRMPILFQNVDNCQPIVTSSIHEPVASYCDVSVTDCSPVVAWTREWVIHFIGLFSESVHRGPYCLYKPWNHNLYIGTIIFPHMDNTQFIG